MNDSPHDPLGDVISLRMPRSAKKQPEDDYLSILSGLTGAFNPVRSEQALWRAVILQALLDACSGSHKDEAIRDRREARRWLTYGGSDFDEVCYLAGYTPDYMKRLVNAVMARDRKRVEKKPVLVTPIAPTITYPPVRKSPTRSAFFSRGERPAFPTMSPIHLVVFRKSEDA